MDNVPGSFLEIMLVKVTIDCGSILHFSPSGVFTKYVSFFVFFQGPMWREIRGKGLAYSYSMTLQPSEGSLNLKLARAAQLTRAYEEALNILVSK